MHPSIVPVRLDWLARHSEAPLEPTIPIVDAHHHCLEFPGFRYYDREFLADIAESGHNVVASVHAETGRRANAPPDMPEAQRPVYETVCLVAEAEALPPGSPKFCLGIVGSANLRLGAAVGEILDAHLEAGKGRFKGIRQITPWDADGSLTPEFLHGEPRQLANPRFREGFAELRKRGLSFDSWIYSPQIPELAELADAFPDVTIILDHCGTPVMRGAYGNDKAESFRIWAASMVDLARRPNVYCKLGGLAKWISGLTFHERPEPPTSEDLAQSWQPYIDASIEAFGTKRCLFESNFPQEKPSCSYGVFWNACKRMVASYSSDEKTDLFSGTACRAYRLTL
jgi:predicted TIM-barrel fold metal-dependent hydrolase